MKATEVTENGRLVNWTSNCSIAYLQLVSGHVVSNRDHDGICKIFGHDDCCAGGSIGQMRPACNAQLALDLSGKLDKFKHENRLLTKVRLESINKNNI